MSCQTYSGTLCKDYVTYPVYMVVGKDMNSTENYLISKNVRTLQFMTSMYPDCIDTLLSLICLQNYPRCNPSAAQVSPIYPCKSLCTKTQDTCKTAIDAIRKNLPDCNGNMDTTTLLYPEESMGFCNTFPIPSLPQTSSSTLVPSPTHSTTSRPKPTVSCPDPLVLDPMSNRTALGLPMPTNCINHCCIPCPLLDNFYPKNEFTSHNQVFQILCTLSFFGILFLSVMYTLLPSKRGPVFSSIRYVFYCCTLMTARSFFTISGNIKQTIQCTDSITASTQESNLTCATQGGLIIFSVYAYAMWGFWIAANFFSRIVLKKEWIESRQWLLHTGTWPVAAIMTIICFAVKGVKYVSLGHCFLGEEWINPLFMAPITIVTALAFVLFFSTSGYILMIIAKDPKQRKKIREMKRGAMSSSASNLLEIKVHLNKYFMLQWRSFLWYFLNMFLLSSFVVLYYSRLMSVNSSSITVWADKWFDCIISPNGSQDVCSNTIAKLYLPSGDMMKFMDYLFVLPSIACLLAYLPGANLFNELRKNLISEGASYLSSYYNRKSSMGSMDKKSDKSGQQLGRTLVNPSTQNNNMKRQHTLTVNFATKSSQSQVLSTKKDGSRSQVQIEIIELSCPSQVSDASPLVAQPPPRMLKPHEVLDLLDGHSIASKATVEAQNSVVKSSMIENEIKLFAPLPITLENQTDEYDIINDYSKLMSYNDNPILK